MKKITLNETDLMKIIKRVLNEQEDKEFNEDQIEFLYWIFERELKPPFREDMEDNEYYPYYPYFNRDGERIGWLRPKKDFTIRYKPCLINIEHKVCQVFEFSYDTMEWWGAIKPHLKSWLESQLNIEIRYIELRYIEL